MKVILFGALSLVSLHSYAQSPSPSISKPLNLDYIQNPNKKPPAPAGNGVKLPITFQGVQCKLNNGTEIKPGEPNYESCMKKNETKKK